MHKRVTWLTLKQGQRPVLSEQVVEGDLAAAVAHARTIAREPDLMLGQILEIDGRVRATFAPGDDVIHYAT